MEIELQYDRVKNGRDATPGLHSEETSNPFTVRLPEDLAEWLNHAARRTGVSKSGIIREALEEAGNSSRRQFLRLAGTVAGPADLSTRKGFSRK